MGKIQINIQTDNAAFHEYEGDEDVYTPSRETARILREIADLVEAEGFVPSGLGLTDLNGHKVGTLEHDRK